MSTTKKQNLLDLVFQDNEDFMSNRPLMSTRFSNHIDDALLHQQYFSPLGISLFYESQIDKKERYLQNSIFGQILKLIEEKLSEFESRLNNTEQIHHLSNQVRTKQMMVVSPQDTTLEQFKRQDSQSSCQPEEIVSPKSKIHHKPNRSKSSYTQEPQQPKLSKIGEEAMHSRMNNFEKKIKAIQDQVQKVLQKDENLQKKLEIQITNSIKETESIIQQGQKQQKEVASVLSEYKDHQRQLIQYASQIRQDYDIIQTQITQQSEEAQQFKYQVETSMSYISKVSNQNVEDVVLLKEQISQVENEILIILKNYKDILMENVNLTLKH
ncbi:hypothetical protein pb186bvf_004931 [Paramecium bursaria]